MRPRLIPLAPLLLIGLLTAPLGRALAQPDPDTSQWPEGRPGSDFNVTDAEGRKQGRWIRVYPNGRLYYSGTFEDDRPVGHFTFFRENGGVLSEVQHDVEQDVAKAMLYREDGSVSHRGHYRTVQHEGAWTQRKTGRWEALDKQGRLRVEEHYEDDVLEGPYREFHSNGQLLEEGMHRAGNKTGTWTSYNREGGLRAEELWREGERHGTSTVYQDNGQPSSRGDYERGMPIGTWTTFTEQGKVRSLVTYEGGRAVREEAQNGEFDGTYPSGRPEWVGRYAHGRLDGPFTSWHDLGEWVMVPAEDGRAGGGMPPGPPVQGGDVPMRRELRNQPMKEMGEYTAGVKDGTWRYFDERGDRIRTEIWNLGRLESTEE